MPHLTDTRDGNYDKFRFVEFDKNGKGSFSCGPYSEGDMKHKLFVCMVQPLKMKIEEK